MKLSIHLVTWNGEKYLQHLCASLRNQTFSDWELIILDNASTDGTVATLEREMENFPVPATLTRNQENTGFAGGHNALFKKSNTTPYVLLLNQDMQLAPDCLEKLVRFMDEHPEAAVATPRLMRWDFARQTVTQTIDAIGLRVYRNRRVVDWHTGRPWDATNSDVTPLLSKDSIEVFGVSGTLPLFRWSALASIVYPDGALFDGGYGSYKEDVDVAYRLRAQGLRSFVVLVSVAYHDRGAAGVQTQDDRAAAENKQRQSARVRYPSYRNHLATLWKNEYGQNLILDFPWILWYEWKKFLWFVLFDRAVLHGLIDLWRQRAALQEQRRWLTARRTVNWQTMRQWWT